MVSDRKLSILAAVVDAYLNTGEPVGSKYIADYFDNAFSSATVRNEMAGLEKLGLLKQPHTSAGRIPTHRGIRLYVDSLMKHKELSETQKKYIDSELCMQDPDPAVMIEQAGALLAHLTNFATVSTTPTMGASTIAHIDLVQLGSGIWAVTLMTDSGYLKSGICRVRLSPGDAASVLSGIKGRFVGRSLCEITPAFTQTLAAKFLDRWMVVAPIVTTVLHLVTELSQSKVVLEGQSNLLTYLEFSPTIIDVLRLLGDQSFILPLFADFDKDIAVKIGEENDYSEMADTSIVRANYYFGDNFTGSIGIIGPIKMDYADVIAHIDYFRQILGNMLSL